jgi:hypothetical protein
MTKIVFQHINFANEIGREMTQDGSAFLGFFQDEKHPFRFRRPLLYPTELRAQP